MGLINTLDTKLLEKYCGEGAIFFSFSSNKNLANERNTKFNGLTEGLLGFYVNIPELGCNQKNDNDKFSCK